MGYSKSCLLDTFFGFIDTCAATTGTNFQFRLQIFKEYLLILAFSFFNYVTNPTVWVEK